MMKHERKKTPADYPLISFRVSTEEEKQRLNDAIEEVQALYNEDRKENEKIINKNDIIVEALDKGLAILKKAKK
jgi:hypothetical protein